MRRLLTRTILAVAAAAAALVLGASSASAATTFTITGESGDGQVTATSSHAVLTTPRVRLSCTSSTAHVINVHNGTGLSNPGGQVDSVKFSNCSLGGFIQFNVVCSSPSATSLLDLNADSGDSTGVSGTVDGNVSCHIHGTSASCEADVIGSPAHIPADYTNSNHTSHIPGDTDQNLRIGPTVTGCSDLLIAGDNARFSGDYVVQSPDTPLAITSP